MSVTNIFTALCILSLTCSASANQRCDTEFGVCLDGKRSDFYPNKDKLRQEHCSGYPNLTFYCYSDGDTREFSWAVTPARAYSEHADLFASSGFMQIENEFSVFNGPVEIGIFQQASSQYTFNVAYSVDYDGYDPFYIRGSHYAYRATVELLCDGRAIATTEPFVGFTPGSYGGTNVENIEYSAVFSEIQSSQCSNNISVKLTYEGQKFRLNKLSLAILKET